eukprot:960769_1
MAENNTQMTESKKNEENNTQSKENDMAENNTQMTESKKNEENNTLMAQNIEQSKANWWNWLKRHHHDEYLARKLAIQIEMKHIITQ